MQLFTFRCSVGIFYVISLIHIQKLIYVIKSKHNLNKKNLKKVPLEKGFQRGAIVTSLCSLHLNTTFFKWDLSVWYHQLDTWIYIYLNIQKQVKTSPNLFIFHDAKEPGTLRKYFAEQHTSLSRVFQICSNLFVKIMYPSSHPVYQGVI